MAELGKAIDKELRKQLERLEPDQRGARFLSSHAHSPAERCGMLPCRNLLPAFSLEDKIYSHTTPGGRHALSGKRGMRGREDYFDDPTAR
ncbi:hypothetical protein MYX65_05795 [Acidobacteria bacterium AH-259-L09]|nr:hypothetical protein [Acidobacteria bacterium AH-259-L09]